MAASPDVFRIKISICMPSLATAAPVGTVFTLRTRREVSANEKSARVVHRETMRAAREILSLAVGRVFL